MPYAKVKVQYNPIEDVVAPLEGAIRQPRPCRPQPALRSLYIPTKPVMAPMPTVNRPHTSAIDSRRKSPVRRRQPIANYPPPAVKEIDLVHEAPPEEAETKNHNKELVWFHHRWLEKHGKSSSMKEERNKMVLMRRWFEFLDTDGSGEIGLNELEDPLVSVGLAKCRMDVRRLIQTVDDSDNGEVNFDEFLTMMHGKTTADNSVVKLFTDLQAGKLGDLTLPFPVLITAYRRRMLLNAHMGATDAERSQGHSVLTALELTRREAAIQEEEDALRAAQRPRRTTLDMAKRIEAMLKREDMTTRPRKQSMLGIVDGSLALRKPPAVSRGLRLPDLFD
ncbi:hypothetical protein AC1031_016273 [Aphanomyces cochlioides]|nr:hypothetical protein AC1031_016273 [Aphanomyces cochlioides]